MKTILITGSCGFIGKNLLQRLNKNKKFNLIATYNNNSPEKNNDVKFIKIDLNDKNKYSKLPKKLDCVIHLAANRESLLKHNEGDKQIYQNFNITQNLANYCIKINCQNFIFLSSVYIYSGLKKLKFKESYTSYPTEPLGLSKFICESILKKTSNDYNFKCISFRAFTVYGAYSSPKQFISSTIKKIQSNKKNIYFGNSLIKRDFIYIDDVTKAIEISLDKVNFLKKNFEPINLGSGKSISIKKAVNTISKKLKINKNIHFDNKKVLRVGDTNHQGEFNKIKKILNWMPSTSFQEGISKMFDKKF